jgi:hypothetical protein
MKFLFMDESGDYGFAEGSSDYYILAGISIDDLCWKEYFWKIQDFRRQISQKYGLKIEEIKGSHIFSHTGPFFNSSLTPKDLEWIYERIINIICGPLSELFVSVKSKKAFRQEHAQSQVKKLRRLFSEQVWREYLTVYEEFLIRSSIETQSPQTGLIYFDDPGGGKYVRRIVRECSRKWDRQSKFPAAGIIGDVVFGDSRISHFIQLADILAFSICRLATGRGKYDVITIKREIVDKLRAKLSDRIDFGKLP